MEDAPADREVGLNPRSAPAVCSKTFHAGLRSAGAPEFGSSDTLASLEFEGHDQESGADRETARGAVGRASCSRR